MALLIDNDVVDKLAELDLLQEAGELLRSKFGDLIILDTLKFRLCPKKSSKRKKRNDIVMGRIESFIENGVIEISLEVTNEQLLNAIEEDVKGLDIGEMQLLQALFDKNNEMLLTGDKRFLKALVNTPSLDDTLKTVDESFICFEQIILFLMSELDFEFIKTKFVLALNMGLKLDATLKQCFEGQDEAVKSQVIQNLNTHIEYLRQESGQLLCSEFV